MQAVLPRMVEPLVTEILASTPVVVLEGGRAVGKSTACDRLIDRGGWQPRIDLSDEAVMATLRLDPQRFLSEQRVPCVIDEAQLEPQLTVWVKRLVDERRTPGQFVLTGSARLGREQLGGSDPLAGRAVRVRMWSMTQRELAGQATDFVDRAFGQGWAHRTSSASEPPDAVRAWRGGMPGLAGVLLPGSTQQWEREVAAYVEAALPLAALGTRADLGRLLRTFRYLAANSGQLVNFARAASDLAVQAATVRNHIELLESAFLLVRVEAERPTESRVVSAHPRIFAADTGLATWASRAWATSPTAAIRGSLTETLVAHDLGAAADANQNRVVLRHWRDDRNKREVDLLLVHPDGRYVPIEVKASTSVGPGDTGGLLAFAEAAGERCERCLLLYEGVRVIDLTPPGLRCEVMAVPRNLL